MRKFHSIVDNFQLSNEWTHLCLHSNYYWCLITSPYSYIDIIYITQCDIIYLIGMHLHAVKVKCFVTGFLMRYSQMKLMCHFISWNGWKLASGESMPTVLALRSLQSPLCSLLSQTLGVLKSVLSRWKKKASQRKYGSWINPLGARRYFFRCLIMLTWLYRAVRLWHHSS